MHELASAGMVHDALPVAPALPPAGDPALPPLPLPPAAPPAPALDVPGSGLPLLDEPQATSEDNARTRAAETRARTGIKEAGCHRRARQSIA